MPFSCYGLGRLFFFCTVQKVQKKFKNYHASAIVATRSVRLQPDGAKAELRKARPGAKRKETP